MSLDVDLKLISFGVFLFLILDDVNYDASVRRWLSKISQNVVQLDKKSKCVCELELCEVCVLRVKRERYLDFGEGGQAVVQTRAHHTSECCDIFFVCFIA